MSSAKNTTWKPTGEDQVYLYHKLTEDPHLAFKSFEEQHVDWITRKGYLKRNLRTHFAKSKDCLKILQRRMQVLLFSSLYIYISVQIKVYNYVKLKINDSFKTKHRVVP